MKIFLIIFIACSFCYIHAIPRNPGPLIYKTDLEKDVEKEKDIKKEKDEINCIHIDDRIEISPIDNVEEVYILAGIEDGNLKFCAGNVKIIDNPKGISCKEDQFKNVNTIYYKIYRKEKMIKAGSCIKKQG